MLIHDPPVKWKHKLKKTCHVISTKLDFDEAKKELLDFAEKFGIRTRQIQCRSLPWKMHIDIIGEYNIGSLRNFNVVSKTRKDFINIIRKKREKYNMEQGN